MDCESRWKLSWGIGVATGRPGLAGAACDAGVATGVAWSMHDDSMSVIVTATAASDRRGWDRRGDVGMRYTTKPDRAIGPENYQPAPTRTLRIL